MHCDPQESRDHVHSAMSFTALDERSSSPTPSNDPGLITHSRQHARLSVIFNPVTQVHHYPPAVHEDESWKFLCGPVYPLPGHKAHGRLPKLPLTRIWKVSDRNMSLRHFMFDMVLICGIVLHLHFKVFPHGAAEDLACINSIGE